MCGICGLYDPAEPVDRESIVRAMNDSLVHRGPDGGGQFTDGPCSLAMRRLAIIDVAGGQQPMANEDGRLQVVFNGEIYNYPELHEALLASGRHQFRSRCDTEVLLHLYEEHGPGMVAMLRGMFAFCIYDRVQRSLFLRDRYGEKPLFLAQLGSALGFSSEVASLLQWPAISRRLDRDTLFSNLLYGYPVAPRTAFAEISQLPAGHWALWQDGQLRIEQYFEPDYQVNPDFNDLPTAAEAVRDALLKTVQRQMASDVPLGAFLSGGIDSSSIVAAMQRQSSRPVKTFTVRFEHTPYDESPIARRVAKHLGTDHHEFVITNRGFEPDDLWRIVRHVGQPFADTSAIPTYFIARQIREHVTVGLSGDGGDEMFAGYNYFLWNQRIDRFADRFPRSALNLGADLLSAAARLPPLSRVGLLRQARRAFDVARQQPMQRAWSMDALFEPADLARSIGPRIQADWQAYRERSAADWSTCDSGTSRLRQLMQHRIQYTLAEDMLVKIDRMSMAASLEVRAPMLGADMAAVAAQMPDHMLIHNGVPKYVLREAVRDWLFDEVFDHPKTGFSIPMHMFQNEAYRHLCGDLLLGDRQGIVGELFDSRAVEQIVVRGLNRKRDGADLSVYRATHQLWALLQLAAWAREFNVVL